MAGEPNEQRLVNIPQRGFEPETPICVNEQVTTLLQGCGVLTAAAAQMAHSAMVCPSGCLVWASDLKAFISMDELVAPSQHPRERGKPRRELLEDGQTLSSHSSQRDSMDDSPRMDTGDSHNRTEVTMNHTQAIEQQAFAQARGAYDFRFLEAYEVGSRTTQQTLTTIAQAADVHFINHFQVISANWSPARFRAWAICDFRPSSFAGTNTSCRISWFSPTGASRTPRVCILPSLYGPRWKSRCVGDT
jgi:hypothetical protein